MRSRRERSRGFLKQNPKQKPRGQVGESFSPSSGLRVGAPRGLWGRTHPEREKAQLSSLTGVSGAKVVGTRTAFGALVSY